MEKSHLFVFKASDWASFFVWVLDILALGTLASTSEVHYFVFLAVFLTFFFSQLRTWVISERLLIPGFILIFLGGLISWLIFKIHPILVAASIAPLSHSLLWLASKNNTYRSWRMGMGFIELTLASALTTDIYLPISIVTFIVLASVALSCNFLDQELSIRSSEKRNQPLPRAFILKSIGLAFLIFLTSILIFPILPRIKGNLGGALGDLAVGYTEKVNISEWTKLKAQTGGKVVLRLYPQKGLDLTTEFYLDLLRGRALSHFDGNAWAPSHLKQPFSTLKIQKKSIKNKKTLIIETVREPLDTDILPVPYGTRSVELTENDTSISLYPRKNLEWVEPHSHYKRVRYNFLFIPNDLTYLKEIRTQDLPTDEEKHVPAQFMNDRMIRLTKKIFSSTKSEREKIQRLRTYFREESFSASTDNDVTPPLALAKINLSPLEEFLFIHKQGHCEWFSSAAALLLRMEGIPTRLIAGFRINKSTFSDILTIRNSDAHAWIEAWTEGTGWFPIDATPRVLIPNSWFNIFSETYDWLSAYWYRYIVTYGENIQIVQNIRWSDGFSNFIGSSLKFVEKNKTHLALLLVMSVIFMGVIYWVLKTWYPWVFSIQFRVREGPAALRRERIKMETFLKKKLKVDSTHDFHIWIQAWEQKYGATGKAELDLWRQIYLSARFGPVVHHVPKQIQWLRASYLRLNTLT